MIIIYVYRTVYCILNPTCYIFLCVYISVYWSGRRQQTARNVIVYNCIYYDCPTNWKKSLKKNYRRPTTVWILLYTAVTRHYSHPSLVRGVSDIVRIIVYNIRSYYYWYQWIPKNNVSWGVGNIAVNFDRMLYTKHRHTSRNSATWELII